MRLGIRSRISPVVNRSGRMRFEYCLQPPAETVRQWADTDLDSERIQR